VLDLKLFGQVIAFDSLSSIGKICGNDGKIYKFHCSFVTPARASIYPGRAVAFVPVMTARGFWAHSIEILH